MDDTEELTEYEELSDVELDELIVTHFVTTADETKKDVNSSQNEPEIECARALASPLNQCISPIRLSEDCGLLEDYPCLLLRQKAPEELLQQLDGATQLLANIRSASQLELKSHRLWDIFDKSKKWKTTSRVGELALIDALIGVPDARPVHLHVFCRRLTESDIITTVKRALECGAPFHYRSLLRLTVKTDMPLRQFLVEINGLIGSCTKPVKVLEVQTTGVQKLLGVKHDKKFMTGDLSRLAELEHVLSNQRLHSMNASVRLWMTLDTGVEDCVTVRVDYHNEIDGAKRTKTIVIEQLATPPRGMLNERRVSFGPDNENELIEFQIADGAPFHPLRLPTKIYDIIEHLEGANEQLKISTTRC